MASYQGLKSSNRGIAIVNSIVDKAIQCNLDRDVALPECDAKEITEEERDTVVGSVYKKLIEIESRLLPCGLHVIGCPPSAERPWPLVNIASIDRPEVGPPILGLPQILAKSVNRDIEEIYRLSDKGNLDDVNLLQDITMACRSDRVRQQSVAKDGRIDVALLTFSESSPAPRRTMSSCFEQDCLQERQQGRDGEGLQLLELLPPAGCEGCRAGLPDEGAQGEYVEPGPGGDPIRNPDVLPTGKNIHALDPQAIPTSAAVQSAQVVVERLIERQKLDNGGAYPGPSPSCFGEPTTSRPTESPCPGHAHGRVRPKPDALGRVNKLELIPLEELGRPRIDVVVNCSGVFRDLFVNQMNLLDRAIKLAAEQDEPQR